MLGGIHDIGFTVRELVLYAGGPLRFCPMGVAITVKFTSTKHLRVVNTEMRVCCSVIILLLLIKIDSSDIEETN